MNAVSSEWSVVSIKAAMKTYSLNSLLLLTIHHSPLTFFTFAIPLAGKTNILAKGTNSNLFIVNQLTSAAIRKTFLDFFASKGHQIVPSAPIVVKNDPTLMFTNAGMNQFKDYFLANKQA